MNYSRRYVFPQYSEHFPVINQTSLLAKAVFETATITQAPLPMIYLTAITSVSVALQGLINVELPIGKVCPVSIWALTIAGSGERKSTVENLLTKGIKTFNKERVNLHQKMLHKYNLELELHEKESALIKKG